MTVSSETENPPEAWLPERVPCCLMEVCVIAFEPLL